MLLRWDEINTHIFWIFRDFVRVFDTTRHTTLLDERLRQLLAAYTAKQFHRNALAGIYWPCMWGSWFSAGSCWQRTWTWRSSVEEWKWIAVDIEANVARWWMSDTPDCISSTVNRHKQRLLKHAMRPPPKKKLSINTKQYTVLILKSHARTVVRECCKGDDESQWERVKFDPPPPKNPLTDGHQNLRT